MHYSLVLSKKFDKEFRKIKFSRKNHEKYVLFLSPLLSNKTVSTEARNHRLSGEYRHCKEFHISGDLLVIYQKNNDTLKLLRIGSHAQLFR